MLFIPAFILAKTCNPSFSPFSLFIFLDKIRVGGPALMDSHTRVKWRELDHHANSCFKFPNRINGGNTSNYWKLWQNLLKSLSSLVSPLKFGAWALAIPVISHCLRRPIAAVACHVRCCCLCHTTLPMSSSTGRLAQPHSTEASAVASHKKYHINTTQHKSKMLGRQLEILLSRHCCC